MTRRRRRTALLVLAGGLWLAGPAPAGAEPGLPGGTGAWDVPPDAWPRAAVSPASIAADPAGGSGFARLRQAWRAPAASLDERVTRVRRTALERGLWNLEAAALDLIHGGPSEASAVARARAAVVLAPDAPSVRMALARALWLEAGAPIAAARAALGALLAIPRHLEASLWFAGTALAITALALFAGGVLSIAACAAHVASRASHDLGDALTAQVPAFARWGLLLALLLVPTALGEGLLGWVLGLVALATLYGRGRQRLVAGLACAAVLAGAFPAARLTGAVLGALSEDPVLEAAVSATRGFASPVDVERLEAARGDRLAIHALAVTARRAGDLAQADARYQRLLGLDPRNPVVANNAANVRLELGHLDSALELFRRSAELEESAAVLFNLSQAYGRAFQVEELDAALAAAQRLDSEQVAEFTRLQGSGRRSFTVDLRPGLRTFWERLLVAPVGAKLGAALREPLAPGRLGSDERLAAGSAAAIFLLALAAGSRLRISRVCGRCGRRLCPRCDPELGSGEVCESCHRLFHQPETTDPVLRRARIDALRARDERVRRAVAATSVLLPGAAGVPGGRPGYGLVSALAAAFAGAALLCRNGIVPDPGVAGALAPLAFGALAAVALLVYAVAVGAALAPGRRG